MSRALGGARRTLRSATPLSRPGAGPEALRPGITAGLPWTNDGSQIVYDYACAARDRGQGTTGTFLVCLDTIPTGAILPMTNVWQNISTSTIVCAVTFLTPGAITMGNNLMSGAQRGEGR